MEALGHGIRSLQLRQPALDPLPPLDGEVMQGEDVRPEADPVLVGECLTAGRGRGAMREAVVG